MDALRCAGLDIASAVSCYGIGKTVDARNAKHIEGSVPFGQSSFHGGPDSMELGSAIGKVCDMAASREVEGVCLRGTP